MNACTNDELVRSASAVLAGTSASPGSSHSWPSSARAPAIGAAKRGLSAETTGPAGSGSVGSGADGSVGVGPSRRPPNAAVNVRAGAATAITWSKSAPTSSVARIGPAVGGVARNRVRCRAASTRNAAASALSGEVVAEGQDRADRVGRVVGEVGRFVVPAASQGRPSRPSRVVRVPHDRRVGVAGPRTSTGSDTATRPAEGERAHAEPGSLSAHR